LVSESLDDFPQNDVRHLRCTKTGPKKTKAKKGQYARHAQRCSHLGLAVNAGLDGAAIDFDALHARDGGVGVIGGGELDGSPATALAVVAERDISLERVVRAKLGVEALRAQTSKGSYLLRLNHKRRD